MPNMPSGYSAGVTDLISQMLQYKPDQRPSAQDILKKSFIQKNIESFLTNTSNSKQKKNSSKSKPGRPLSAAASHKKSNPGSKDEIDSATPHEVEEEKQFFADNDLPTIKQQHVSPQIKQSRSPSFPCDAQSSNGSRESTEDFTLTPKKKLSSSSLKGAPKQLLPDMKEVGKNREPSRNGSSIKIQSSQKLSTPDSKQTMGGSAPSTMLKEMVTRPPDKKQPPLSPLARPSSSKKTPSTNYQPPKSAAPPTTRQKSDPGRDQEVRRSKPREERLKKKEQEFAEKDSKKRRPQSALVTSSDGHSESNYGSPYLSDDSDTGSVHKSVEKSETKEEPTRSSVYSCISEGERENNHLNMSGGSASTSDTSENMNEEMDDLMTLLTATLHMDQDNGREEEMLPRDFANSHISANTIAPALQTITLSAKPKDRMKVLQRELEAVFSDDVIAHCLEVMMNSKDEETEDVLKGILGQDKFELYIGKLWHLMLLKKSNKN